MTTLEWIAEQRILEAQAHGAFEALPGRGRPLDLGDDTYVPAECRAAFRLLKNAGLAPDWVMLGQAIDQALNRAIDEFNLRVPLARLQKSRFRI